MYPLTSPTSKRKRSNSDEYTCKCPKNNVTTKNNEEEIMKVKGGRGGKKKKQQDIRFVLILLPILN